MSNPSPRSNSLYIPIGQAIEVVLRSTEGKQLNTSRGTRILYHTIDGEEIWTSIDESRQIQELGLRQNEPLRIYRRKNGNELYTVFSRVADPEIERRQPGQASNSFPVAAAANGPRSAQVSASNPQTQDTPKLTQIAHDMASCHIAAIDALLVSAEYAKSKGLQLPITPESVHTTANTLYIQLMRNGGVR